MQEKYGLAVRADLGFAIAEHARTLRFEPVTRGADVVDLITDVVNAAVGIALKKFCNRGRVAQRLKKLDLGVGQGDENRRHAVIGLGYCLGDLRAERAAIDVCGLGEVAHRDRHMIEPSDHVLVSCTYQTSSTCTWHVGFLPQAVPSAARTALRIASATASGSRRRP